MTNKNLYKKLQTLQKDLEPIIKNKENPYFKSKYADINSMIEVVKPILQKNNLVLLQPITEIGDNTPAIKTIIIDSDSGESISGTTPLSHMPEDPQKAGSQITYFRRYALQSFLFIQAEDDDANMAANKTVQLEEDVPFEDTMDFRLKAAKEVAKQPDTTPTTGGTCDRCKNGEMQLKEGTSKAGKHYKFYGCSNYPRCHNTKDAK